MTPETMIGSIARSWFDNIRTYLIPYAWVSILAVALVSSLPTVWYYQLSLDDVHPLMVYATHPGLGFALISAMVVSVYFSLCMTTTALLNARSKTGKKGLEYMSAQAALVRFLYALAYIVVQTVLVSILVGVPLSLVSWILPFYAALIGIISFFIIIMLIVYRIIFVIPVACDVRYTSLRFKTLSQKIHKARAEAGVRRTLLLVIIAFVIALVCNLVGRVLGNVILFTMPHALFISLEIAMAATALGSWFMQHWIAYAYARVVSRTSI